VSETTDLVDVASDATPSTEAAPDAGAVRSRRRGSGLSGMLLPELQRLAGELGITGTARMRKSDLVAAISERQVGGSSTPAAAATTVPTPRSDHRPDAGAASSGAPLEAPVSGGGNGAPVTPPSTTGTASTGAGPAESGSTPESNGAPATTGRRRRTASRPAGAPATDVAAPVEAVPAVEPVAAAGPARSAPVADPAPVQTRESARVESAPVESAPVESAPVEATSAESAPAGSAPADGERPQRTRGNRRERAERDSSVEDRPKREDAGSNGAVEERGGRNRGADAETGERPERGRNRNDRSNREDRPERSSNRNDAGRTDAGRTDAGRTDAGRTDAGRDGGRNDVGRDGGRNDAGRTEAGRTEAGRDTGRSDRNDGGRPDEDDDDFEGSGRRRGRRYRDRNRRGGNAPGGRERFEPSEPTVSEDDVLLPVAGILDVLDSYAFVRTSGYLTGPNDVYVSLSQVRRYGLRRGDAITGAVRQPREGERKDKYNALVRLDSVNGLDPEQARNRPEFTKLTPLYPQERLRLETDSNQLTTRLMDLVMPIGKGQRALIVSPPKAGKTMVLQAIANAITTNNPECHLMVVLVDERPEEVTDMQRSVKGEVIASTFDRPPSDHTTVAELSIERAKRLVEMGHDVVVLLDSITRLGRAYNLAAPASGRILSGGVDSTALYPPKRFLGAARNIENGGSLTIIASALVETGSTMDTVIFEEFKGTGNAEIKLDRRLADKRVFPAVDVNASGTRKEEILLAPDELAIIIKLRRVLSALEPQQAIELLLDRMRKTRNNIEFLMQVQKTTLGLGEKD
jgi:transcription termination factor Rho